MYRVSGTYGVNTKLCSATPVLGDLNKIDDVKFGLGAEGMRRARLIVIAIIRNEIMGSICSQSTSENMEKLYVLLYYRIRLDLLDSRFSL